MVGQDLPEHLLLEVLGVGGPQAARLGRHGLDGIDHQLGGGRYRVGAAGGKAPVGHGHRLGRREVGLDVDGDVAHQVVGDGALHAGGLRVRDGHAAEHRDALVVLLEAHVGAALLVTEDVALGEGMLGVQAQGGAHVHEAAMLSLLSERRGHDQGEGENGVGTATRNHAMLPRGWVGGLQRLLEVRPKAGIACGTRTMDDGEMT